MSYCPNCGVAVSKEQKFCEDCGTEIPKIKIDSGQQTEEKVSAKSSVPHKEGGLFDLSRNYYVIKERAWDLGYGDIMDENGKIVGKMNRILFSVRRRVELQELDGVVAATIHSKIVSARGAQDLKDPAGNLIARIKKKILTFLHPKFFLEDPFGNRWYEAVGNFMGWSFKVYEVATGKQVAEIEKADRWRDVFLGGIFDFADTYALKILDDVTDRRILVGFVLSIDNTMHDTTGMGPMIGPGPRRRRRF